MTDYKSTSQYTVSFKGQSSTPYVNEPVAANIENLDYMDLQLSGPSIFSDSKEDYDAYYKGVELKVIKVEGNVLTVEFQ